MILDAAHLERNQVLRGDVAIAGAGAAGITLAHRLADAGLTCSCSRAAVGHAG